MATIDTNQAKYVSRTTCSSNRVLEMHTTRDGEKVRYIYSKHTQFVTAYFTDKNGRTSLIKNENMPKEVSAIKSPSLFYSLFASAYTRTASLDNGDMRLYLLQRIRGGGESHSIQDVEETTVTKNVKKAAQAAEILGHIEEGQREIAKRPVRENVILIVGRTGSGKSTLGNLLAGVPMFGVSFPNEGFGFDVNDPIMPISHSNTSSCTKYPTPYSPPATDYTFVDCPGFGDTHGVDNDIPNAFFRKEITKNAQMIKILLLVDYNDMYNKGIYFTETMKDLIQFLGCCEYLDTAKAAEIVGSIAMVITKVNPQKSIEELDKEIQDTNTTLAALRQVSAPSALIINYENQLISLQLKRSQTRELPRNVEIKRLLENYLRDDSPMPPKAKMILKQLIYQARWGTFSSPLGLGACGLADAEKIKILDLLNKNTRYISKLDANLQIKVSDTGFIGGMILLMVKDVKQKFSFWLIQEIEDSLIKFYGESVDETSLRKIQQRLNTILEHNKCSLMEFVSTINVNIPLSPEILEEARQNDVRLKFFIDLLSEKQEVFSYQRNWLSELNLKAKMEEWKALFLEMTIAVKPEISNGKLILRGYFPRISQIDSKTLAGQNISCIEIYALHTVYIDASLRLHGVDITIIAPSWDVSVQSEIDLTGVNGQPYFTAANDGSGPSQPGSHGLPGQPGGTGGTFFGIGERFIHPERLKIITSGGQGGAGQNGGNGINGSPGANGTIAGPFVEYQRSGPFGREGWHWAHQEAAGGAGGAGGNGGQGGTGGLGGLAGLAQMIEISEQPSTFNLESIVGQSGSAGNPGKAGEGGDGGRSYLVDRRDGDGVISDSGYRYGDRYGAKGADGQRPIDTNSNGIVLPTQRSFNANALLCNYKLYLAQITNFITSKTLEAFCASYEDSAPIKAMATLQAFIDECSRVEDLFTQIENKLSCLPLYRSILQRMEDYEKRLNEKDKDLVLLQTLQTLLLSKILRLNAADNPRLIIDIKGFLDRVKGNIAELNSLEKERMIKIYKSDYEQQIIARISEANVYITRLNEDIVKAYNEISVEIDTFIKEIDARIGQLIENKEALAQAEQKLKHMMRKKARLATLNLAIQATNCFPPYGPLVGNMVNAGMNIINKPSSALKEIGIITKQAKQLKALLDEPSSTTKDNEKHRIALTQIKELAETVVPLAQAGVKMLKERKIDKKQLGELQEASRQMDLMIGSMRMHQTQVRVEFKSSLEGFVRDASQTQRELEDKSLIARDYSRLEVKRSFENFKQQIRKFTSGFRVEEGFVTILRRLEEAIETSMDIYDRVQDYRDRITLVDYMAKLAAPVGAEQNPNVLNLKLKIQYNIILEQYARCVTAVQQWSFPFAHIFLADFPDLQQFSSTATPEELMKQVKDKLESLRSRIGEYRSETCKIDLALTNAQFDGNPISPFYKWSSAEHAKEILGLLKGQRVMLYADANYAEYSAVKFNTIGIRIKHKDESKQAVLDQALERFKVEIYHSGHSDYKYSNYIYRMTNEGYFGLMYTFAKREDGLPKARDDLYDKMRQGNLLLSPYTSWVIQIIPVYGENSLFKQFGDDLSGLEIELIGTGSYVDETKTTGQLHPERHYMQNMVKTTRPTHVISYAKGVRDCKQANADPSQNASNQNNNNDYWYQATDIHMITESPLFIDELQGVHLVQPISRKALEPRMHEILNELVKNKKPVLCIYNISNMHWVTFALLQEDDRLIVLYKDSNGFSNSELEVFLRTEIQKMENQLVPKFYFHAGNEQEGDINSCGVFALRNLIIMASQLRQNAHAFVDNFHKQLFCNLEEARTLRAGAFASYFEAGVVEHERGENLRAVQRKGIREHHEEEAEGFAKLLRDSTPVNVRVLKDEETLAKEVEKRTIAVEVGVGEMDLVNNTYNYYYRITCTTDLTTFELQQFLQNSPLHLSEDQHYRIDNGVIYVYPERSGLQNLKEAFRFR